MKSSRSPRPGISALLKRWLAFGCSDSLSISSSPVSGMLIAFAVKPIAKILIKFPSFNLFNIYTFLYFSHPLCYGTALKCVFMYHRQQNKCYSLKCQIVRKTAVNRSILMKFDRSNKFDVCYEQVNSLRLKSSVAS